MWSNPSGTFSLAAYTIAPFTSGNYLGVHAYCAIGEIGGDPTGGWQRVYSEGNNNWYADDVSWGSYAGQVVVDCLNFPGAGM